MGNTLAGRSQTRMVPSRDAAQKLLPAGIKPSEVIPSVLVMNEARSFPEAASQSLVRTSGPVLPVRIIWPSADQATAPTSPPPAGSSWITLPV